MEYEFTAKTSEASYAEVEIRYGLLHEARRKKINYQNKEPISYRLFYEKVTLN